jgi:hypothetical protein
MISLYNALRAGTEIIQLFVVISEQCDQKIEPKFAQYLEM